MVTAMQGANDWISVAVLALSADQLTKYLVERNNTRPRVRTNGLHRIFRLVYNNRLGYGAICNSRLLGLLWLLIGGSLIGLNYWIPDLHHALSQVGIGLAFGGASGNLLDLLIRKAVVDFIDLRVWPVFNLADACIVIGTACVAYDLLGGYLP